jgi:hypothetical protein
VGRLSPREALGIISIPGPSDQEARYLGANPLLGSEKKSVSRELESIRVSSACLLSQARDVSRWLTPALRLLTPRARSASTQRKKKRFQEDLLPIQCLNVRSFEWEERECEAESKVATQKTAD